MQSKLNVMGKKDGKKDDKKVLRTGFCFGSHSHTDVSEQSKKAESKGEGLRS